MVVWGVVLLAVAIPIYRFVRWLRRKPRRGWPTKILLVIVTLVLAGIILLALYFLSHAVFDSLD